VTVVDASQVAEPVPGSDIPVQLIQVETIDGLYAPIGLRTARINPQTGLLDVEKMLMREPEKVRPRITEDVARARMESIRTPIFVQGRDGDELQGIFRVCYDLLIDLGKDARWASYDHAEHGFVFPQRNAQGVYAPDAVQRQAVADSMAHFERYRKGT
jgi:hypothetical protein